MTPAPTVRLLHGSVTSLPSALAAPPAIAELVTLSTTPAGVARLEADQATAPTRQVDTSKTGITSLCATAPDRLVSARRRTVVSTMGGKPISTVIYLAAPATNATIEPNPYRLNIDLEIPAMNTPHPLDDEVIDMNITHRNAVRLFASDGVIDANERAILDALNGHRIRIGAYRLREVAADSFKRNGLNKLTRRRFADAGANVSNIDDHRTPANVIAFPTRQEAG